MNYIIISSLRRLCLFISIMAIVSCLIIGPYGIFRFSRYDAENFVFCIIGVLALNVIVLLCWEIKCIKSPAIAAVKIPKKGNNGLFFLWLKRKRLEEQQRIRDLEAKK